MFTPLVAFPKNTYIRFFARSYAYLAVNTNLNTQNTTPKVSEKNENAKSEADKEEKSSSTISSITSGFNSASQWTNHYPIPDPNFEVVSAGTLGASLLVKIPPRSEIFAVPGTAIAVSSKVITERTTDGNIIIALGRKLAGGSLVYHKFITSSHSGDVVLAPRDLSDIAVINMDGTSVYYVRKGAFLARGPRVTVNVSRIYGMGSLNAFANRVTGRGTLVISNYGAIHRLILNPGDAYLVNAKHILAWNSKTKPILSPPLIASSSIDRSRLIRNITAKLSEKTNNLFDPIFSSPSVRPTLDRLKRISIRTRIWMFGGPEYLKLTGPGDFYLSSRVAPVLGGFKSLTSPSIEEIVAADPIQMEQQNQLPSYIPSMSFAVIANDGKVIFMKPPKDQSNPSFSSPLSPPSPEQDEKSTIGKIVSGDGMLQLRRWVKGVVGGNKDIRRE
ncbi:mitochondrial biogenesis AIM24-domain-containing protein [Glomus cerebriforme]|uniref:Altered inheritance of mitochondria protein 24, mitochondrial n=1 Tax=Glomus cerebriforme TaxID=658196 RepID=A0A397TME6_9GLOM|nr:mitochondrial biogenesis AIM24-domain-containing protein [Glomus cerebriforme]